MARILAGLPVGAAEAAKLLQGGLRGFRRSHETRREKYFSMARKNYCNRKFSE
jgi:hypothetical protein